MPRSAAGLDAAGEWPALRAMLPDLRDRRILDLGCGFGWHCRYAREQGAGRVVGVDLSEKMLARARAETHDPAIEYRRQAIEDINFPAGSFDVVISSLALHYIERVDRVCQRVHDCLVSGGAFVLSVEHPVFTALEFQDWHYGADGKPQHWPVDRYADQGPRRTRWLTEGVIKYHRTVSAWINTLLECGFTLRRVEEPAPTADALTERPEWIDERRRPMFLLMAAERL
ncbi:MAG: class I SAM-dependent methyltransferase [Acidobacteriota bacterium]